MYSDIVPYIIIILKLEQIPSGHMAFIQWHVNVNTTTWCCTNLDATSQRCVPAGLILLSVDVLHFWMSGQQWCQFLVYTVKAVRILRVNTVMIIIICITWLMFVLQIWIKFISCCFILHFLSLPLSRQIQQTKYCVDCFLIFYIFQKKGFDI